MTPENKAREIYTAYYTMYTHPHSVKERQRLAKECATYLVDEIIGVLISSKVLHKTDDGYIKFYSDVKEQIQKL